QIDEIQATGKSVMPEGLETQLSKQDVMDLIAYLQVVAVPKKNLIFLLSLCLCASVVSSYLAPRQLAGKR
ncbi:MAG TPA: hypothetical protein VH682_23070, partial [Gemmataceae bacterium]